MTSASASSSARPRSGCGASSQAGGADTPGAPSPLNSWLSQAAREVALRELRPTCPDA